MIGFVSQDLHTAIDLLREKNADHLMGKGGIAEGDPSVAFRDHGAVNT